MHHWQFFLAKYTRATLVSSSRLLHCNFKDLSASISSFSILEYSIKEMASLLMLISSSLAFSKEEVVYLPIKTLCRCCSGCCNMDVKNLDTVSLPFVPAICRIDKLSWGFPTCSNKRFIRGKVCLPLISSICFLCNLLPAKRAILFYIKIVRKLVDLTQVSLRQEYKFKKSLLT